jgi:hypothetical protein
VQSVRIVIHPMDSRDRAIHNHAMDNPGAYCGPAIARAKALLATAREIVAAARNHRHVAVLRRALDKHTRGKQKPGSLPVHKPPAVTGSSRNADDK